MRAITYSHYGPPEVLQLSEVEKPVPKDDEVLIRVRAVEATKADCEMRSFKFAVKWFWLPLRIALGVSKPKRQILGGYFAGEVESCGKDVSEFTIGQEVFGATGLRFGAYGEYVALPASYTIIPKPDKTYDVIFDMVAGSSYTDCMKVLSSEGRYLSGNPRLSVMLRSVFTSLLSSRTATFAFANETRDELHALAEMIEEGTIKSIVDRVLTMDQAAKAHRLVETEQRLGAIVITIDDGENRL